MGFMNGMRDAQSSKVPGLCRLRRKKPSLVPIWTLSLSLSLNIPGYHNQASSVEPTEFSAHNASVIYMDNFYANIIGAVKFFLP